MTVRFVTMKLKETHRDAETNHGVVKRALGWSEAGVERRPGNWVYDDFLHLYISTVKRATNNERIAAERYYLIISE